jgi:hypothetical protein
MNVQKVLQYHDAWCSDVPVGFSCHGEVETFWVRGLIALDAALCEQGSEFQLIVLNIDPLDPHLRSIFRRIAVLAPQATVAMCNCNGAASFGSVAA